jgi:hypothetical protein
MTTTGITREEAEKELRAEYAMGNGIVQTMNWWKAAVSERIALRQAESDLAVARGENERLLTAERKIFCMWCFKEFDTRCTPEQAKANPELLRSVYEEATAHDQVCPKNPLTARVAELENSPEMKFVRHIEGHLFDMGKMGKELVVCKICGKTILEIAELFPPPDTQRTEEQP